MPISETTEADKKKTTFKYTKLAVKTVKCYWYYWIIQDLKASLLCTETAYIQYGTTYAASYVVECLEVVHFSVKLKYLQKPNSFLAALMSAYVRLTSSKTVVNQLTVCMWMMKMLHLTWNHMISLIPIGFSWNDVTHAGIQRICEAGIVNSFKWRKQKMITTFKNPPHENKYKDICLCNVWALVTLSSSW